MTKKKSKFAERVTVSIFSSITNLMCKYENCRQKPLMPSHHPLRHDGSVVCNSHFFEALETFPWRPEWVKAVLHCLRRKEAIAPPNQPIYSFQALEYLEMLGLKIARGMKNMQFEETYDEWSRLLRESGLVHPLWKQEDCEFVRNTLSSKPTTVELFQEIVSFKRQGGWFTYELLGFSHSDIDEVFDWSRVFDNNCLFSNREGLGTSL